MSTLIYAACDVPIKNNSPNLTDIIVLNDDIKVSFPSTKGIQLSTVCTNKQKQQSYIEIHKELKWDSSCGVIKDFKWCPSKAINLLSVLFEKSLHVYTYSTNGFSRMHDIKFEHGFLPHRVVWHNSVLSTMFILSISSPPLRITLSRGSQVRVEPLFTANSGNSSLYLTAKFSLGVVSQSGTLLLSHSGRGGSDSLGLLAVTSSNDSRRCRAVAPQSDKQSSNTSVNANKTVLSGGSASIDRALKVTALASFDEYCIVCSGRPVVGIDGLHSLRGAHSLTAVSSSPCAATSGSSVSSAGFRHVLSGESIHDALHVEVSRNSNGTSNNHSNCNVNSISMRVSKPKDIDIRSVTQSLDPSQFTMTSSTRDTVSFNHSSVKTSVVSSGVSGGVGFSGGGGGLITVLGESNTGSDTLHLQRASGTAATTVSSTTTAAASVTGLSSGSSILGENKVDEGGFVLSSLMNIGAQQKQLQQLEQTSISTSGGGAQVNNAKNDSSGNIGSSCRVLSEISIYLLDRNCDGDILSTAAAESNSAGVLKLLLTTPLKDTALAVPDMIAHHSITDSIGLLAVGSSASGTIALFRIQYRPSATSSGESKQSFPSVTEAGRFELPAKHTCRGVSFAVSTAEEAASIHCSGKSCALVAMATTRSDSTRPKDSTPLVSLSTTHLYDAQIVFFDLTNVVAAAVLNKQQRQEIGSGHVLRREVSNPQTSSEPITGEDDVTPINGNQTSAAASFESISQSIQQLTQLMMSGFAEVNQKLEQQQSAIFSLQTSVSDIHTAMNLKK